MCASETEREGLVLFHVAANHINRHERTARAVVQHHNAAIHITMHNTQRQFCLQTNITSQMWP